MGTAGFVCGLLSAILGLVPLLFVFAFPLGLLGIVFGAIGWRRAVNEPVRGGKELSIAGVVLRAIGLVLAILWVVALNAIVNESDQAGGTPAHPAA